MLRRMMTRMVMLRLPGPAQLKCRAAFQKSHFLRKFTENNAATQIEPRTQTHIFVRACAGETHVKISQEPLYQEIQRKNAAPQIEPGMQTHILREPAQSKSMSTCHKRHQKSHFIRKYTGKMPQPRVSTLIKHRPLLWTHCLGNKRDAAIAYNTKFVSKTSPHLPSIKSWPVGPQIRTMRKIASL